MSNSLNVCVVEDNLPIRKLFSTLLKKSGFVVNDFENPNEAINWLRNNSASIILLDILLPGINGYDAIKIIREIPGYENIPVIAITGLAAETDKNKLLNSGFNHYMTKPVNISTFAEEVKNCLGNN
jgi:two-component system cell cycle response regulator DivK